MFSPISSSTVGDKFGSPAGVAVADVNGDGIPDILIAANDGLHVLTGAGGGQFELSRLISAGDYIRVITADFNRDGKVDVAAAARSGSTAVMLGDGAGGFKTSTELSGFGYGAGDLNGDAVSDLVLLQSSSAYLFFGVGNGTFRTGPSLTLGSAPRSLVLADFNNDGKLDIAVSSGDTSVLTVLLGTGGGAFRISTFSTGCGPGMDLATGSFNRDGIADLVVACDGIAVLAGRGDGSFTPLWSATDSNVPLAVAAGDFNGDGLSDIVVTHYYGGLVSVLLASSDGTFRGAPSIQGNGDAFQVLATDLNGDSRPDLVVASYSSSSVWTGLGSGGGAFPPLTYFGYGEMARFQSADLDGDGKPEFVTALPFRKTIVISDFVTGRTQSLYTKDYPFDIGIGDTNRDGFPDVVVATVQQIGSKGGNLGPEIQVLPGRGDGNFGTPISTPLASSGITNDYIRPVTLALGDFTGSGNLGVAVANNGTGTLDLYRGNGNGTFVRVTSLSTPALSRMIAGEFNGDGIQDLAALRSGQGVIDVYAGAGTGLNPVQSSPVCDRIMAGVAGDFNGDHSPDLIVACNEGGIRLLANSGSGLFPTTAAVSTAFKPGLLALADFDNDGKADIAGIGTPAVYEPGFGQLFLGNGDGSFRSSGVMKFTGVVEMEAVMSADGSRPDLAVLATAPNTGNERYRLSNQPEITLLRNAIPNVPPSALAVMSSASFASGPIAPESLVTLFGQGLSSSTDVAASLPLPTELGGTRVVLTDANGQNRPASLHFVSSGQINILVPYVPWWEADLRWSTALISVISNDTTVAQALVKPAPAAPALFTANADGRGVPAAIVLRVKADGTQATEPVFTCAGAAGGCVPVPIQLGPPSDQVLLVLFGTGIRYCAAASVSVVINGVAAEILASVPQGDYPGLDQVNVLLPSALAGTGQTDLKLTACGTEANTVRVDIR
jgi:uncharacterized protein (TIGR03437 family)